MTPMPHALHVLGWSLALTACGCHTLTGLEDLHVAPDASSSVDSTPADTSWSDSSIPPAFRVPHPTGTGSPEAKYNVAGDVQDTVTGLSWTRPLLGAFSFEDASAACGRTAGGKAGWRLPTVVELSSLLDYTKPSPEIDRVFAGDETGWFWTSDEVVDGPSLHWAVTFEPQPGAGATYASREERTAMRRVRCVRAAPTAGGTRFEVRESTTLDLHTHLEWANLTETLKMTRAEGESRCAERGFRLPSVKELFTLVDLRRRSPAVLGPFNADTLHAGDVAYISGTTVGPRSYGVRFSLGVMSTWTGTETGYVRCVRSSL